MDYGFPCYYPFPHPIDPFFVHPPFPYELPEPEMPVKVEEAQSPEENEEIEDIQDASKSVEFLQYFEEALRKKNRKCIKYMKKAWTQ